MNYKAAFAIDDKHYRESLKNITEKESDFMLNNFDHYEPKLVKDFYLKYFIQKLLLEVDILELNKFLEYHYDYCDDPELLFNVLDLKIVPKIGELIENARLDLQGGGGYYNEIILENGFIESRGVVHNSKYDYSSISGHISWSKLQQDCNKRIEVINTFLKQHVDNSIPKPLKWIAGPSQLGFIVSELIDKGYMEAERRKGEVNYEALSKELFKAFSIDGGSTLKMYLSPSNKKHKTAKKTFEDRGFFLPPSKFT
ncbi:hypothetical protein CLV86_2620 [Lacinutrix venerupis]|uniref:hypothetical protein n=1 Tax=Lacinutrix venerupis TaxID=1486034 RepID=UPI000EB24443|nr:hypothetical protein [Lacinutrix venerupis]RLJ61597.1 hypothetical protein CLV86_2620 [Lacinutrix venerupis]